MKSNRLLPVILLIIIVVFVGLAGWLYFTNSKAVNNNQTITSNINDKTKTLAAKQAEKVTLQNEAKTLASELTAAQTALSQTSFRSSAESIEYDSLLFSIAADNKLQITSLTTSPPSGVKEGNNNYQLLTFSVNVEGMIPDAIFAKTEDSAAYITATINHILAFTDTIAHSADFDTAVIPSVSITEPAPMTDQDVAALKDSINSSIQSELTADETQGLTDDQIAALVQSKLAALKSPDVQVLIAKAGISKPSAAIQIQIWTYKGA